MIKRVKKTNEFLLDKLSVPFVFTIQITYSKYIIIFAISSEFV